MTIITLQKALQDSGFDSRRNIRRFIAEGKFKINGTPVTSPHAPVVPGSDKITFENRKITVKLAKKSYFIFNKPDRVVSTLDDPQKRVTIKDYIKKISERVYPVGRLDFHSEGLMILTNDGEFTNFVISPKNKVPKIYLVKIKGLLNNEKKTKLLTKGISIDGFRIKPLQLKTIKKTDKNSWIKIVMIEGKKHVIRKMFRYSGHPVEKLRRIAIGNIKLKKLPLGHWREIPEEEIESFKKKYLFYHTLEKTNKEKNFD